MFYRLFPTLRGHAARHTGPGPLHDVSALMPRYMRSLEVWLLGFCGAYGLLVSSIVTENSQIQLLCLGFIGLAIVRQLQPAATQHQWFWGAMAALALALVVYLHPASGGSSGPYLFLLLLLAMGYPLLMRVSEAAVFGSIILAVYLGSAGWSPSNVNPALVLVRMVLIAGICALSAALGQTLRRSHWLFESLLRDNESGAYNEHGLHFYGRRLLARCNAEGQPLSLALLRMPSGWIPDDSDSSWDLLSPLSRPSGASLHRNKPNDRVRALRDIAHHLARAVPPQCLVVRLANGDWVILAPRTPRERLLGGLIEQFGRPLQIPFGAIRDELFVPITPCVVQASMGVTELDSAVSEAYEIWTRGERSGMVSLE